MADRYPKQQVGVADGTEYPALKADGAEVGAHKRVILASKVAGTVWTAGSDRFYLGKKPKGHKITSIKLATDTSLTTTTIDIGDGTTVDKYVDGATLTTVNTPTELPLKASTLDDDPGDEEDLWATILTTNIAAAVLLTFMVETAGP